MPLTGCLLLLFSVLMSALCSTRIWHIEHAQNAHLGFEKLSFYEQIKLPFVTNLNEGLLSQVKYWTQLTKAKDLGQS